MHTWYYIVPNYPRLSLALFFCDISFKVRFYDEVERKKYTKIVEDLHKSDKLEMSAEMMHERGGTRFSISSYTPETDNNGDFSNTDNDIRFSISDGSRKPLTHNERVLRDGIVEQMRLGKLESKAKAKLSDTEHKVWNKIVEYVKRALCKIKLFFKPEHTGTQRTQREIDDYIRDLIVDSYANMRSGNTAAVQGEGVRMSAKAQEEVDGISRLAGVNNNSSWSDALSAIAATSHAISDTGTPGQSTNSKDAAKVQQISEIANNLHELSQAQIQLVNATFWNTHWSRLIKIKRKENKFPFPSLVK